MMIKRLISLFSLIAIVLFAQAQSPTSIYTARLSAADISTGARVVVSNDATVTDGLRTIPKNSTVVGYRICLFFDNTQNGRNLANSAIRRFQSRFPNIPSEVIYANPTFKAMAGYCINKTEATMMLGWVVEIFPDAFMVREESMPISKLAHYNSLLALPSDTLSVRDTSVDVSF